MGVNNGSAILEEEQQETSTDQKTYIAQLLRIIYKPRCGGAAEVPATLQQIKLKLSALLHSIIGLFSHYRQLAHYFSLLCFLLTIITLFQTFCSPSPSVPTEDEDLQKKKVLPTCVVQITLMFQSQSILQETKLRDLTNRLEKLNQSYRLLFSQYPALNEYCPVSNSTTSERVCRPCQAGWTHQGEKCFLFSQDRADWISSQYHCLALGGAVATVRTEEEQVFLWKKAQSLSHGDSYWLGLRSSGGDRGWQWSDGSPVEKGPKFWEREPDQTDSRELCGRLAPGDDYRRSWFTYRCSNLLRRICERRQATLQ